MRRVLMLGWGLPLIVAVAGCSSGQSVVTSPQSSSVSSPVSGTPSVSFGGTASSVPTASLPASASVGDTLALSGTSGGEKADVTVVKIVDPASAKEAFSSPKAGERLVAVQFRIRNTGTAVYDDSPSNGARLVDNEGQQFTARIATDTTAGPSFPGSVMIAPGDTALGYITFTVPTASRVAKVQFALNSGFAPSTGQWTVS